MKTKTKTTLLLALLLALVCTAASAQEYYTLPEIREQAAAGWHETYTDKYGRETTVDIDVQVFGEDKAPVLKVGLPDYVEYTHLENNPYLSVTNVKSKGGQRTYIYDWYGKEIDLDTAYGADYGNNLTLRDAYSFIGGKLIEQGISPDGFILDQPRTFQMLCNTSQKTGEVLSPAFYHLSFWPKLHELPLLTHVMRGFVKPGWPDYSAEMSFMMSNENSYTIAVFTLVEQEMIEEDIPLCSIKKIIESAEREIEEGHIQKVSSLRFGYTIYNDPTIQSKEPVSVYDAKCFYAVPSWVLECKYVEKGKETYDENTSTMYITINAQTGKMIDPLDKSKFKYADGDYKGVISWDKVQ